VAAGCGAGSVGPSRAAWAVAAPPPGAAAADPAASVPPPDCFAYAPARRAYACLGYALDPEAGPPASPIVRRATVDVLAPGAPPESHAVRASDRAPVEDAADVEHRLAVLGFGPARPDRVRLVPGRWVAAGPVRVRYDLRLHEGDASFEYVGDVVVGCPGGAEHRLDVRRRGLELGDAAWLFRAPGAETFAISVHGIDGGEGVEWHWLDTIAIDGAALCAGRAGAVGGPIAGRAQGP